MTRTYLSLAVFSALLMPLDAGAADLAVTAPPTISYVPQSAFYFGLGGSFNSADFGTQNVFAVGTTNVVNPAGAVVSSGSASGPGKVFMSGSEPTFAPSVQAGYFQKFSGTDWLWGAKFSYSNLRALFTVPNVLIPQAGANTSAAGTVTFLGTAVAHTYQANIEHQLVLTPFIGRSFERSFIYLGAGPTLSRVKTNILGLIGFANLTGTPSDISGAPQDFSGEGWVWDGAAVIGATYFFDPSWFLDVNYTYAQTANKTFNYFSTFSNPTGANTIIGTLSGSSSGKVITQGVMFTLNKSFSL